MFVGRHYNSIDLPLEVLPANAITQEWEAIPEAVRDRAKLLMLDAVGNADAALTQRGILTRL